MDKQPFPSLDLEEIGSTSGVMNRSKFFSRESNGHFDVLDALPAEYRQIVTDQCVRVRRKKGETLWNQGDEADYVALLIEGTATAIYHNVNGKVGTIGFWFPGDLLGASNLGASDERQGTVRFLQNVILYILPLDRLYRILKLYPEISLVFIKAVSVRLRWVARLALTLETEPAVERVCAVLLLLSEKCAVECDEGTLIDLSLTHSDIAAVVGVTRQFINATLRNLERMHLIKLKGRKIFIVNRKRLESMAYQVALGPSRRSA